MVLASALLQFANARQALGALAWSAVISLTSRAGGLRITPSEPDDRDRAPFSSVCVHERSKKAHRDKPDNKYINRAVISRRHEHKWSTHEHRGTVWAQCAPRPARGVHHTGGLCDSSGFLGTLEVC